MKKTFLRRIQCLLVALFVWGLAPIPCPVFQPASAHAQNAPAIIPDGAKAEQNFSNLYYNLKRWAYVVGMIGLVIAAILFIFGKGDMVVKVAVAMVILAGGSFVVGLIVSSLGS